MNYLIIMENPNDKKDILELHYDTENNIITNIETNEIFKFNNLVFEKQKVKDKKITIQLGFSCNMKCSYCLQSKTSKSEFNKEQADNLIDKLLNEDLENSRIEFWGGEPLLYIEEIKYIVSKLSDRRVKDYLLFTNGLLLNNDDLNFLVANNFNIILSHDGPTQYLRGTDPLSKPNLKANIKWLVFNYEKFGINSVITNDNINTKERMKYFATRLGVNTDSIKHSGEGPAYNVATNIEPIKLGNEIYLDIVSGEGFRYGFYQEAIKSFISTINHHKKLENITTKCGIDNKENYKIFSIDGKDLSCHNYNFKFDIKTLQDSDKCKKCLVANLCKSSCPAIDKNSEAFRLNCEISYETYNAILRAALALEVGNKEVSMVIKI